jgi:hypothetical protein
VGIRAVGLGDDDVEAVLPDRLVRRERDPLPVSRPRGVFGSE